MRLSIVLASLVGLSYANVIPWNLLGDVPGNGSDTVIVTGSNLALDHVVTVNSSETLVLQASDGIIFGKSAQIRLAGNGSKVYVWSDVDADGQGSLQGCDNKSCFELLGDSSRVLVVESQGQLSTYLQNLTKTPWLGISKSNQSARGEHLIQMNTWADLLDFSQVANTCDAPLQGWGIALGKSIRATSQWTPLRGKSFVFANATHDKGFSGIIDGQGHGIVGLNIDASKSDNVGFIGTGYRLWVRNLAIDSASVSGQGRVGMLVGTLGDDSKIDRCWVRGQVQGQNSVGGMVGLVNQSTIQNVYSEGLVKGHNEVGGLIGTVGIRTQVQHTWSSVLSTGSEATGGLAGMTWQDSKLNDSYWQQDQTSNKGSCSASKCAAGAVSGVDMNLKMTYNSFDFDQIWSIQETIDHPRLIGVDANIPKIGGVNQSQNGRMFSKGGNSGSTDLMYNVDGVNTKACNPFQPCFKLMETK